MSWKQIDGNVPFLDWSEEPSDSDKYPKSFWLQKDGSMPYRATPWTADIPVPGWVSDGTDSPFQIDFPIMKGIDTYPNTSWKLDSLSTYELKQIPYKLSFADMYKINDAPNSAWVLESASNDYLKQTPYKRSFADMYNYYDSAPKSMWVLAPDSTCPYKICFPPLYRPHKERRNKYRTIKVILTNYNQRVTIRHGKDVS